MKLNKLIVFLTLTVSVFANNIYAVAKNTAGYYLSDPTCVGKVVTLNITESSPSHFKPINGYTCFLCYTASYTELGDCAWVYVPDSYAKSFYRNYGKVKAKATVNGKSKHEWEIKPIRVKVVSLGDQIVFVVVK